MSHWLENSLPIKTILEDDGIVIPEASVKGERVINMSIKQDDFPGVIKDQPQRERPIVYDRRESEDGLSVRWHGHVIDKEDAFPVDSGIGYRNSALQRVTKPRSNFFERASAQFEEEMKKPTFAWIFIMSCVILGVALFMIILILCLAYKLVAMIVIPIVVCTVLFFVIRGLVRFLLKVNARE